MARTGKNPGRPAQIEQNAPSPEVPAEAFGGGRSDHSFTLQTVMEMQKSIGKLTAEIERLIADRNDDESKLDKILHQMSFLRGAGVAASALIVVIGSLFIWMFSDSLKEIKDGLIRVQASQSSTTATQPQRTTAPLDATKAP